MVRLRPGVQGVFREFQSLARPLRVTAGRNQGGRTEREPPAWRGGLCAVPRGRYGPRQLCDRPHVTSGLAASWRLVRGRIP